MRYPSMRGNAASCTGTAAVALTLIGGTEPSGGGAVPGGAMVLGGTLPALLPGGSMVGFGSFIATDDSPNQAAGMVRNVSPSIERFWSSSHSSCMVQFSP